MAHAVELIPELSDVPSLTSLTNISPLQRLKQMSTSLCQAELDRVREDAQSSIASYAVLHAAFWHVQLVTLRLQEYTTPPELLDAASKIIDLLPSIPHTPLQYHCAALAGLTLAEVATQQGHEAVSMQVSTLEQALSNGKEGSWEQIIRQFVVSAAGNTDAMMGLQHLADAAVGDAQTATQTMQQLMDGGFDAVKLLKEGYLGIVAGRGVGQ